MTYLRLLLASAVIALCTGCASPAQISGMSVSADQAKASTYDSQLRNNVRLSEVNGGDKTNPLWTSEIDSPDFGAALKQSLANANLLGDESASYALRANLLRVDQPIFGLDFEVTSEVEYTLIKSRTNKVVLREIIRTPFTAGMGDSVIGIKRLRLANEGSARVNIIAMLKRLSDLKIEAKQVSLKD
ncbi:hypothetical protein MO767_26340 [Pseudomonas sp. UYIF39]|uniref:hypothetical protein n=1 Tax=Pseudomonas sp. UYIF39 TaxID=1630747 RepID=UPI00249E9D5B|nr:hypothetical protein [Pseudomonas sp. UYIF39]MDI3357838.1 hypothetical protein [Pseudomonas sp. UYIF39]